MTRTVVCMEAIRDVAELRRNISSFRNGWEQNVRAMHQLGLFRSGRFWVYDPDTGDFANAKFAGYRGMTVSKYSRARNGNFEGYFTGGVNKLIARRLRQKWREAPSLSGLLIKFATELAGETVLDGIDQTKWRFIVVPSDRCTFTSRLPEGTSHDSLPPGDPDKEAELCGKEGGRRVVLHVRAERNSGLVADVKESWYSEDKNLPCIVCGFSFLRTYGNLGRKYIEAHHRELLSSRKRVGISTKKDFDRVCSNCHRMLHRMGRNMNSSVLKRIVQQSRSVR